jgi:hypothetical protein
MDNEMLTVIGSSFLWPIVSLWEIMENKKEVPPSEFKTGNIENGYSTAIIILTMAMVESYLNRTRHVMIANNRCVLGKDEKNLLKFHEKHLDGSELTERLTEMYSIRDVILHNHIWEAVLSDEDQLKIAGLPKLNEQLYGDKKYDRVRDRNTNTSRLLKLNLIPTKIWREDARTVIKNAYEILYHLQSLDYLYCVISWIPVQFKGKGMEFSRFVRILSGEPIDYSSPIAEYVPE